MNEWFRRPPCGCKQRPDRPFRPAPPPERPSCPDVPCDPTPCLPGCFLMQRILASGRLHRRRQCYPLCLGDLPSDARPPFTVLDVAACAFPQWEECPDSGRQGFLFRVTVPLSVRLRDGCGRTYVIQSFLEERLCLRAEGPAAPCWRGQCFVQAAVRLAGRPCPCDDSPCSVPLEVLLEGYSLAPCTVGRSDRPICPPARPWYPQPMYDRY